MKCFNSRQFVLSVFLALLFFGALFWAKGRDPFSRDWFTVRTANHDFIKCIVVLPKPIHPYPVVVYAHGSGGTLMNDGKELRQIAEFGLAAVSFEYNQTNEVIFASQFQALLDYMQKQIWVNTNMLAWVGFSLGANRIFDFALHHPEQTPKVLVKLGGSGADQSVFNLVLSTNLHCPVLLIHGGQDEVFPVTDTERLASALQTNGRSVELKIIPGLPHSLEPERGAVFRGIGEYCRSHLAGENAWQNYHSIAQWQNEASPLRLFWLVAAVWAVVCSALSSHRKTAEPEIFKLKRHEIALRWLAVLLATWALAETAIHLVSPRFSVSSTTLSIARRLLVQPKERTDFEFLAGQSTWHGEKLKTLLENAELAGYNRGLSNWRLSDKIYRDYVLSPAITGSSTEEFNWRRMLWEEFYPRIRHESLPRDASRIVVHHLRERLTISRLANPFHNVQDIWLKQITDEIGFEIIYVAALRSVGVPARLDLSGRAEFYDDNKWQLAPQPSVTNWL
jgi:pimeloyl-ACP methyl ester carboxylesterase